MRRHAPALAVLAATLAAYASALGTGFVFDAGALIVENPAVHQATGADVAFLLTHDYWQPMAVDGLYRPLTTLSYLVDYVVLGHGTRPFGYHAENVLMHLLCVALVYALVWHLARRTWPAAVAAALFGRHPVPTEAVTNVVGRADLLATAGVLAGVLCWAHGPGAAWRSDSSRRRVAPSAGERPSPPRAHPPKASSRARRPRPSMRGRHGALVSLARALRRGSGLRHRTSPLDKPLSRPPSPAASRPCGSAAS